MQIIDKIIFKPQTLYKDNKKVIEELYIIIKNYYNLGNSLNNKTLDSETLITKKCDIEQIWQQLFFSANILLKKINKIDLDEIKENKDDMNERINLLEEQNLIGRTWQFMGEVDAKSIPHNKLNMQKLKFERCDKFKPKIVLENIEKIIKKRIIEKSFDDVIKKGFVKESARTNLKEINDEKNKYGLAELYEKNLTNKTSQYPLGSFEEKKKLNQHEDILMLKVELFYQLDSLTNFYFRTKPFVRLNRKCTVNDVTQIENTFPSARINQDFENIIPEKLLRKKKKKFFGKHENYKSAFEKNCS